jgi:hypothetical protein
MIMVKGRERSSEKNLTVRVYFEKGDCRKCRGVKSISTEDKEL